MYLSIMSTDIRITDYLGVHIQEQYKANKMLCNVR